MTISFGTIAIARPSGQQWVLPFLAIAALSLLWVALYWVAMAAAIQVWWVSPTYSHCFLILPIFTYLIWNKRYELACLSPKALPAALLIALPAGAAWFAGSVASINEVQQFAIVALFQIILLSVLGLQVYRAILFPALFLFFLVPVGQYLVPPLQHLTTWFVSAGLSALNILHYTEGTLIELANGKFEVAEACAGLRFLISSVALCALFSHLAFRRTKTIILFMVAAIFVPIVGNCFRALGIVLIAHWTDNRLAVGADHLVYGWGFSVGILLVLFGIGARFRERIEQSPPLLFLADRITQPRTQLVATTVLGAVLLIIPPALLAAEAISRSPGGPGLVLRQPPGWSQAVPQAPGTYGSDRQGHWRIMRPGEQPVELMLTQYHHGGTAPSLSALESALWNRDHNRLISTATVYETWAGQTHPIRELIFSSASGRRVAWWFYCKDGAIAVSDLEIKWLSIRNVFRSGGGDALVALSMQAPAIGDRERKNLRWALSRLKGYPMPACGAL